MCAMPASVVESLLGSTIASNFNPVEKNHTIPDFYVIVSERMSFVTIFPTQYNIYEIRSVDFTALL